MFGRSKPVYFFAHGGRQRRRVPRWLILLLLGIALGVGGVLFVQERVLPPRLSASESTELRASFERAESERQRLTGELAATGKKLAATQEQGKRSADELNATKQTNDRLRESLASMVASLPPDPRGGVVQVRAARFSAEQGQLAYDIVLSRDRGASKPIAGVMQLTVVGQGARGVETSARLKPVPITVGSFESLRGSVPMPDGIAARQATIQLLDRPDGKVLGMRVIQVASAKS